MKTNVSKKDIASIKSILKKHFTGVIDLSKQEDMIVGYDSYHGRFPLTSGHFDFFTVCFSLPDEYYLVRALKCSAYNQIGAYKVASIQKCDYFSDEPIYLVKPVYLGNADLDVKELFITFPSTCPDRDTFRKSFNIKYGLEELTDKIVYADYETEEAGTEEAETEEAGTEEAETEEAETEEAETEEAETEEAETEEADTFDIEDVITINKHTDYNAYRREKLLSVDIDTLEKLYCLARSFINGRYYNFRYYITDMKLSCCEIEEDLPFPTIRDYIACRIHVKSNKALAVDEEICCYIVIKDERYAETLIYI